MHPQVLQAPCHLPAKSIIFVPASIPSFRIRFGSRFDRRHRTDWGFLVEFPGLPVTLEVDKEIFVVPNLMAGVNQLGPHPGHVPPETK